VALAVSQSLLERRERLLPPVAELYLRFPISWPAELLAACAVPRPAPERRGRSFVSPTMGEIGSACYTESSGCL
jgi:hypothetical protein